MSEPVPPENVRAVMRDGTEIPLECTYYGFDKGRHVWLATWMLPEMPAEVLIGMLPANTAVGLEVQQ